MEFIVLAAMAGGVLLLAGIVAIILYSLKRERDRLARLRSYALDVGWYDFGPPAPQPVDSAARSRRTKLAMARMNAGHHVWMVWHQWTESSGDTQTTKNLTRYYLWLGPHYPDVQVRRRTSIGAVFMPVRGVGTGIPEFDKRFVIKPTHRHEPTRVVNPMVQQAMMAGHLSEWQISAGTLIQSYDDPARLETLQLRADGITYLASLLAQRQF